MNISKRSARSFNVRSHSGALQVVQPRFSTGFTREEGEYQVEVSDDDVVAAALRILSGRVVQSSALSNPKTTREYLGVRFDGLEHEVFACLYLDNRNRVTACQELFRGTIDGSSVHPREVVKEALAHNAAAVILVHNHPSGVAEPSQADELITAVAVARGHPGPRPSDRGRCHGGILRRTGTLIDRSARPWRIGVTAGCRA